MTLLHIESSAKPANRAAASCSALPTWRSEYPFQSRWLEVGSYRIHYIAEGRGAPLVMVHGNPTWSFLWRHLVRELRFDYRAIAIDHVGCGLSDKPHNLTYTLPIHAAHLVQLVDHLDLRGATLVAHDWGGAIGLRALLERPDRFSRILLFNTGAFPPPFIPWRIRACRIPILGQGAVQGLNLFALAAQRMAVANPAVITPRARAGFLAPYDSWAHRRAIYRFVRDIPASRTHPTWKHLAQLEASLTSLSHLPIQLIWGMQDWCFRPSCLERFIDHWPAAEVEEIAEAGHWVTEEAPQRVLQVVRGFLSRTAS